MQETFSTMALNGALWGGLVPGLLGILFCVWLGIEYRNRGFGPASVLALIRVFVTIIGLFIAIGAIVGS